MKSTVLALLLMSSWAFGQKLQDVSPKDSPLSLSIKIDASDGQPAVFAHSSSRKGILALAVAVRFTDARGQETRLRASQDYAFKLEPLKFQQERPIGPVEGFDRSIKITKAVGAVLFVQFEDGSTWGDAETGSRLRATRPQKLAFLKRLVEAYYESREEAFNRTLNDPNLPMTEWVVSGCLKAEAEYEKTAPIDLAKKKLAAAQGWYASGLF